MYGYMHAYMTGPGDPCRYSDWLQAERSAVRYLVDKAFFSSRHTSRLSLEPIQPHVQWTLVIYAGVIAAGA